MANGNLWQARRRVSTSTRVSRTALAVLVAALLSCQGALARPAEAWGQGTKIEVYNPAGVRADGRFVDDLLKATMHEQKLARPRLAGQFPHARTETVAIREDALAEINTLFYERGWTDGLPIVPPTPERVAAMLEGSDLSAEYVVAELDPMGGQATIEKIAVNAVMAGCRPAYMPVLIAAVAAIADPGFGLRGVATTTNPDAPMMIISGPIVDDLQINAGTNALGRGRQANASLGRALQLLINNVGGSWPGISDMSTLGQPGDFTMVLAENRTANPWTTLASDLGFPKSANLVTLLPAEGTQGIMGIGHTSEGFLKLVAAHLAGLERSYRNTMLLIVAQDTAHMLARDGWTKESMTRFIFQHNGIPYARYKERFLDTKMVNRTGVPAWVFEVADPTTLIPVPFVNQFLIMVAGGPGEKSMLIPAWSSARPITREIRLPWNWKQLVQSLPDQAPAQVPGQE